ncbi:MAG: Holliday junction resolvase RecU [Halanaerobiales bacterium]|nr:Holliday junction resolvase RecU [Halanaerobiales bacterium]
MTRISKEHAKQLGITDNSNKSKNNNKANRGMDLEEMVIRACEYYRNQDKALIFKVPTPIHVVKCDYETGKITLAFFEKKSTVDFIGEYQGKHITFDTKQTSIETRFDLSLVKDHQYEYLKINYKDGGISFLIVSFTILGNIYLLPFELLDKYWINKDKGGRKSIPIDEFDNEIEPDRLVRVGFLNNVDKYLEGVNYENNNGR